MEQEIQELDWSDIEQIIKPVMHVWVSGVETVWTAHAWKALTTARLTGYTSEIERTTCVLRAVALAGLYRDFCARAFDEGAPGDWADDVGELTGVYPRIDVFTLGQLAEREGIEADNIADESTITEALGILAGAEMSTVLAALAAAWGDDALFASLWSTTSEETRYPLPDNAVAEIVNDHVTANKMIAWEWLTEFISESRDAHSRSRG